jgi:hypothetical protein
VAQFYDAIHSEYGVVCDYQEFYFLEERLVEGKSLLEYGISFDETLELKVPPSSFHFLVTFVGFLFVFMSHK